MRNFLLIAIAVLSLSSCKSKVVDTENLPKDIALKPDNNLLQQKDKEQMNVLIKEIDSLIASEVCKDANSWTFAPIGAKPCGGPSSYLAYPKNKESEILPKIEKFSEMQMAFNKKYQLTSDCMLVTPPAGIRCEDGKAVLFSENATSEAE